MSLENIQWPTGRLQRRRAAYVYESARLQAFAAKAPIIPEPWGERGEEFRGRFIEAVDMMCGPNRNTNPAELHDIWMRAYKEMGWVYGPVRDVVNKIHPDMVPFVELPPEEQFKDQVFIDLCEIARKTILR